MCMYRLWFSLIVQCNARAFHLQGYVTVTVNDGKKGQKGIFYNSSNLFRLANLTLVCAKIGQISNNNQNGSQKQFNTRVRLGIWEYESLSSR